MNNARQNNYFSNGKEITYNSRNIRRMAWRKGIKMFDNTKLDHI